MKDPTPPSTTGTISLLLTGITTMSLSLQLRSVPRLLHTSTFKPAIAHPITAHGPPPKAPSPAPEFQQQLQQQQRQREEAKQQPSKPSLLRKRFWRDVDVSQGPGNSDPSHYDTYTGKCIDTSSQEETIESYWIRDLFEHQPRTSFPYPQQSLTWPMPSLWNGTS